MCDFDEHTIDDSDDADDQGASIAVNARHTEEDCSIAGIPS